MSDGWTGRFEKSEKCEDIWKEMRIEGGNPGGARDCYLGTIVDQRLTGRERSGIDGTQKLFSLHDTAYYLPFSGTNSNIFLQIVRFGLSRLLLVVAYWCRQNKQSFSLFPGPYPHPFPQILAEDRV